MTPEDELNPRPQSSPDSDNSIVSRHAKDCTSPEGSAIATNAGIGMKRIQVHEASTFS